MKVINDPSMPRACSERQVLFYPADWEDPFPGTMEEIKICIVNDRATGLKREGDDISAVTPCAKRSCHAGFSCSTPLSARTWASPNPGFSAWHPLGQDEELDDSLLDLSSDESDSPLGLTKDEMDSCLMGEDDDDSCYAAEPSVTYNKMSTCVGTFTPSGSENEAENSGASHWYTLDVDDTSAGEPECEGDLSSYAAMPPSPSPSAIDPVEVTEPNQSSVCNAKFPHELLAAKSVMDSDLPTPLSQLPNSCSPGPLQSSFSLTWVDTAVNWSEDPDLAFDCDIDNLLAISPGVPFLSGEDSGVLVATPTTKGSSSVISDSAIPPPDLESDQILTVHAACSSTSDTAQNLPPLNTAGVPKFHPHPHPPAEPEPINKSLPSTSSPVVTAEPALTTESPRTEQNVESKKPCEAEETKGVQNGESTSKPTDPAPSFNGTQCKIVTSSGCKAHSSSDPQKEKPVVAALRGPSFRAYLSGIAFETSKDNYCNQVLIHIDGQGESNLEDPFHELASLLNQISRENQNWQHPSDLTKRNHPRFGKKPTKRWSLNQWVTKNGGSKERFKNIPPAFQRSPVPDALPIRSS